MNLEKMRHQQNRAIGFQHFRQRWVMPLRPGIEEALDRYRTWEFLHPLPSDHDAGAAIDIASRAQAMRDLGWACWDRSHLHIGTPREPWYVRAAKWLYRWFA